ncbi:hypothetical protein CBR_g57075 [Chara braunii]|uniref:Uncharacterized protein n=1 Tax=Chara braunii TaxID=69332 RepID=A0A388K858_CHABU|nr:hypothetical protein CBR_g57075 [Chara braunii]|eukprot:GBG66196.1 hypothetical protein CBR_g57075 [Chara braunii]
MGCLLNGCDGHGNRYGVMTTGDDGRCYGVMTAGADGRCYGVMTIGADGRRLLSVVMSWYSELCGLWRGRRTKTGSTVVGGVRMVVPKDNEGRRMVCAMAQMPPLRRVLRQKTDRFSSQALPTLLTAC